jgi:hypothetical protein
MRMFWEPKYRNDVQMQYPFSEVFGAKAKAGERGKELHQ